MITKELLDEINALARKQRSTWLTYEEKIRQNQLRKKYLAGFRENIRENHSDLYGKSKSKILYLKFPVIHVKVRTTNYGS